MFLCGEPVVENVPLYETVDATLTVTIPVNEWDGFGFLPVMVRAENKSEEACEWQFTFEHGSRNRRDAGLALRSGFVVTAPGRATRTTTLWLPGEGAPVSWRRVSLTMSVRGSGVQGRSAWSTQIFNGWRGNGLCFAVSPALEAEYRARRERMDKARNPPNTSVMRPEEWPADWRAWSPFAVAVMTAGEFDALDTARQAALRDWVALGGRLYLKPFAGRRPPSLRNVTVTPERHGMGTITRDDMPPGLYVASEGGYGGGGAVAMTVTSPSVKAAGEEEAPAANPREVRALRARPWQPLVKLFGPEEVDALQLSQATWWLIFFLLAFGVVIGPVNLFLWAPAGKRHRLFFTVPVISLGASALLALVIVFHDGFGGEGARRALVMLLPGENKAVVAQQQVSRTGMLLGKNFAIAGDTVLAKTPADSANNIPGKMAERQADAASGDWFTSRAMEGHVLLQVAPTRGRVELLAGGAGGEQDAAPVVQSSMAGVLRDFVLVGAGERLWTADEVPPGRRVTLSLNDGREPAILDTFGWQEAGRFYAVMDGADVAPIATLGTIRWRDDKVFVTGRAEGGAGP
ncbi:MAG: hypothetical protein LBM04_01670 [Opitutaceae bacterium]|nr:hypothetical protein [Opitutaceae bacterium]